MWHPEAHDGLLKEDTSGFVQHSKWPAAAGVATHCSMHSVKPADGAAVATRRSTTTRQASTSAVPRRSILDVQQAGWLYPGAGVGTLERTLAPVMQLLQRVPLTPSPRGAGGPTEASRAARGRHAAMHAYIFKKNNDTLQTDVSCT